MKPVFFNRKAAEEVHRDCLDLGERKCHDYGSVGDGIGMGDVRGVATRMLDKMLRIMSLTQPDFDSRVTDESLRDTLKDMINYATYTIMLMDGTWGVDPEAVKREEEAKAVLLDIHRALEAGAHLPALQEGAPLANLGRRLKAVVIAQEDLPF